MFPCFRVELVCSDRCVRANATTVSAAELAEARAAATRDHSSEAAGTDVPVTTGTYVPGTPGKSDTQGT